MSKTAEKKGLDLSEARIKSLKAEHGDLTLVEIPSSDELDAPMAQYILKRPKRSTIELVAKYAQEKNIAKMNSVLIKGCVVDGDMEYISGDNDEETPVYLSLLEQIGKLVETRQATIKKL